jgi:uncharacterized membrane protein required for colicin V production
MGSLPYWFNPFDALIALATIVGVALGFVRGLLRMAFSVIILYVATVVAMTFYISLGRYIRRLLARLAPATSEGLAFALILIVTAIALHFLLSRTYKNLEWPAVRQVDQLGGMVFGFLAVTLWIGIALIAIDFVLGTPAPGVEMTRRSLIFQFHTSRLIPIYYQFLPIAFATLKPWVPKGQLPDILILRIP